MNGRMAELRKAAVPKTVSRRGFEPHYAHYGWYSHIEDLNGLDSASHVRNGRQAVMRCKD